MKTTNNYMSSYTHPHITSSSKPIFYKKPFSKVAVFLALALASTLAGAFYSSMAAI